MLILMTVGKLHCVHENMNAEAVAQAAEMLRILAHPDRLRIVDVLHTAGELSVGAITGCLGIAQPTTSQHLNHMRRVGLLKTARQGGLVFGRRPTPH